MFATQPTTRPTAVIPLVTSEFDAVHSRMKNPYHNIEHVECSLNLLNALVRSDSELSQKASEALSFHDSYYKEPGAGPETMAQASQRIAEIGSFNLEDVKEAFHRLIEKNNLTVDLENVPRELVSMVGYDLSKTSQGSKILAETSDDSFKNSVIKAIGDTMFPNDLRAKFGYKDNSSVSTVTTAVDRLNSLFSEGKNESEVAKQASRASFSVAAELMLDNCYFDERTIEGVLNFSLKFLKNVAIPEWKNLLELQKKEGTLNPETLKELGSNIVFTIGWLQNHLDNMTPAQKSYSVTPENAGHAWLRAVNPINRSTTNPWDNTLVMPAPSAFRLGETYPQLSSS